MRPRIILVLFLLCAASIAVLYSTSMTKPGVTPRPPVASQPRVQENYGKLPLSFELNQGQTDSQVKFLSRGRGYTIFLTGNEAVLALRRVSQSLKVKCQKTKMEARQASIVRPFGRTTSNGPRTTSALLPPLIQNPKSQIENPPAPNAVRLKLVGANPAANVTGLDELPGKSNYFIGNGPRKWRTNVPQYSKVKYQNVYPGIDLVYYGNQGKLEHDFVVSPGANPGAITLAIEGAEEISVDEGGNLVARLNGGSVVLNKPSAYQNNFVNPKSKITNPKFLDSRFILAAHNQVTFDVGPYDKSLPLIIDPVLSYATYLGGDLADYGVGIAVDSSGSAFVTGSTSSTNFPVTSGAYDTTGGSSGDAFLTKLSPDGSAILYSTYLGGATGGEGGVAVAVDTAGSPFITGYTTSTDFPTTPNAFQKALASSSGNAFVTKFSATGNSLQYSTYLGGSGGDAASALAIDAAGAAYVTGMTSSSDFPTKSPLQSAFGGGSQCESCDWFGDCYYYACPDAFVTKLSPDGSSLVYSSFLGKTGTDVGMAIAVDSSGNAYVGGYTNSSDFPTHNPLQATLAGGLDGFVLKLNPAGSALVFSTFLGGTADEYLESLAIDSGNNIYVAGVTSSTNFPTASAFQASNAGGADAFVTEINSSGSLPLMFSTYLGGTGTDVALGLALDSAGNVYVAGETTSTDFPTVNPLQASNGGGSSDAFISRFLPTGGVPAFSTYLGGSGEEDYYGGSIAVDSVGNAYVTGETTSPDFPTANAVQSTFGGNTDAYVAKISFPTAATVSLIPGTLNFGDQARGTTSNAKLVTLANGGTQPLTINSIALSSGTDYAETHGGCPISPATLAGGAHCTISVTFTPTTTGALTDEVVITSDAPGSPHTVSLSGVGGNPSPVLTSLVPSSVTAGGPAFTLTVNGSNFVDGCVVGWGGPALTTTFVNSTQVTASVTAADIATGGMGYAVTVWNPPPGGGYSNALMFNVNFPPGIVISNVWPNPVTLVQGGSSQSVTVDLIRTQYTGSVTLSTSTLPSGVTATFTQPGTGDQGSISLQAASNATLVSNQTITVTASGGGFSATWSFGLTVNPTVGITISGLSSSSVTLVQGRNSQSVIVTLSRFGYTGSVTLSTSTLPSGVTATFTQPGTGVEGSISLQAASYATLVNNQTITVTASGSGVSSVTATFSLTVNPPVNNPLPTLTSLSPSSATAGGTAFNLIVTGTNFVSNSVVRWNGTDRTTAFHSSTELQASILAADIASAGTAQVTVFNPTPGGGLSNALSFNIGENPVPTLTSLSPSSATVGGAAFILTLNGTNFVSGSVVRWNGAGRTTTYASGTQLTAAITAADISSTGTVAVTVFNPTPGGGTSNSVNFTINNPVPTLTSLSPSSATAGGAAFTLTVNGTNFLANSMMRWNGSDRTTTFVSSTQLTAAIPASDISTRGTAQVTVFNPTPGGGSSSSLSFTINNPAAVRLSAATLDFGNQLMGSTSAAQTVTLTNIGDLDLTISSIVAAGDFSRTTTCPISPSTLAGGANCTMTITFAPTATGVRDSALTITHNAAGSPHIVTLKGTGTDFALGTQSGGSTSATVDAGGTATYKLQIAPTGFSGNVALSCAFQGSTPRGASCSVPSPLAVNGVDPAPFSVSVTTTARSLAGPRGPAQPPAPSPWARHTVPLFIGLMMLMLAAVAAVYDRRRPVRTPALQWAPLAATMLFVLLWAACGGGGGGPLPTPPQTGTPAGTYNLTLTATAGGVSKTSPLTLTVN